MAIAVDDHLSLCSGKIVLALIKYLVAALDSIDFPKLTFTDFPSNGLPGSFWRLGVGDLFFALLE